jgi:hypothetical protein
LPLKARGRLAEAILATTSIAPSKRSRLVRSLNLGAPLDVASLSNEQGDLYSFLVRDGVIEDSDETFAKLASLGWPTRRAYLKRAPKFASYAATTPYQPRELTRLFSDPEVTNKIKDGLISSIAELEVQITGPAATAIANHILRSGPRIRFATIEILSRAGSDGLQLAEIIAKYNIPDEWVVKILMAAREPWAFLAAPGSRKPVLPDVPAVVSLLERLKKMSIVSSWRKRLDGRLQVNRRLN